MQWVTKLCLKAYGHLSDHDDDIERIVVVQASQTSGTSVVLTLAPVMVSAVAGLPLWIEQPTTQNIQAIRFFRRTSHSRTMQFLAASLKHLCQYCKYQLVIVVLKFYIV